ncbi:alpha/beta fold hydrolase, partial [Klebsiella pneumoniae]|uniref:alpha/beta fold hydrolase n=1 Tax=Klebsiella pneumoniae TaxID=573 RepID=UPI003EDFC540
GQSSPIDYEKNPYDLNHMAEDVILILDSFNINQVNIVGMSMGGYIAQALAYNYPARINTITLIMSTINSLALRGIRINGLPGQDL